MTGRRSDPRPARSRARLLDAATALLRAGGPSAVTVDAVTRGANVARATLYRHFPSGNDLLAAAFNSLIPPAPMPPETGSLRDRLVALVQGQAELIAERCAASRSGAASSRAEGWASAMSEEYCPRWFQPRWISTSTRPALRGEPTRTRRGSARSHPA